MPNLENPLKGPVVLCILDGFGYRDDTADNAIKLANTPVYDDLWNSVPRSWLKTSGLAVGLPDGQMGNSEVGHMNIGGGRVVMQDLPRINDAIENNSLASNTELKNFISKMKQSEGTAHLMGLMSPGGVHSHQDHIAALAKIIASAGVPVRIHAFMDGRDTPPRSAIEFIKQFEHDIAEVNNCTIETMTGRYYALDRDQRWERVQTAYDVMVAANSDHNAASALDAVNAAYARGENDEFIQATVIGEYQGMHNGDGLLMANFRADRAREILTAFVDPNFTEFKRPELSLAAVAGMVEYSTALNPYVPTLFPAIDIKNSFGEIIATAGKKQLRISETEKYAHITFFFNGGLEDSFDGEDRILIPSPDVTTYDLKPEMSAHEVTDKLVEAIQSKKYDTIIVNYANPDMVGHTGVLDAAIKAVETVDHCIGRLQDAVQDAGGSLLITADHGNVELMKDQDTGQPHTAHTSFDVPLLLVGENAGKGLMDGALSDIAPTMLDLMQLEKPMEMGGKSLLSD
ncbi:2,3-bisphosphoglycerate-independent phosphoglycerate mutase [Kordiimonas sp. SCSIO 12610]|uniref:2,3-bisphosphoglycerate-independent phosphoglycerate mutase n=1 Tax=Kordiimonas sp. SCSIO 12610 TaxID=2829597 RepID=UPI00210CE6EC|nr:2,3-bisphosphoglycerate-independent phosphoglycerate mutase [Kordiimonas sp. SCSIO 12610]UTW55825.1 2,3-bisphosphoglycerate-independent phosphoglycerate mutase [Kordiimonas sp. SCSIO 12610]